MRIREVKPEDANQLLPLLIDSERYHNVELDKDKIDEKGLENQARNDLYLWFRPQYQGYVLENAGQVIGLALAQTGDVVGKGWIEDVYVAPKYRRQGWAEKLIQQAVVWLKSQGVKRVSLDVHQNNAPALQFYKKLGFKEARQTWLKYEKEI